MGKYRTAIIISGVLHVILLVYLYYVLQIGTNPFETKPQDVVIIPAVMPPPPPPPPPPPDEPPPPPERARIKPRPTTAPVPSSVPPLPIPPAPASQGPPTTLFNREPQAARRVPPTYPRRAEQRQQTGIAVVKFTIGIDGTVKNLVLVREDPAGFGFGESAMKAVARWKYDPQIRDGKPAELPNVLVEVEFKLSD